MRADTSTQAGVLVLCEQHDLSALWAARGLGQRAGRPVDVVTGSMLGSALTWEHRIRGDVAEVEITLVDGRRISSAHPRPVLNRLSYAPTERLARVGGDDRAYAAQEFQALFLSWLSALPGPLLNRPSPQFLAGHWRNPVGWAVLATRAGLSVASFRQSVDDTTGEYAILSAHRREPPVADRPTVTVFVVGGRVVPAPGVPVPVLDACRRLAELAGDGLLGIVLARVEGEGWEFTTATPLPDLFAGGAALLDALASVLGGST